MHGPFHRASGKFYTLGWATRHRDYLESELQAATRDHRPDHPRVRDLQYQIEIIQIVIEDLNQPRLPL
jgi:hypothetical protein